MKFTNALKLAAIGSVAVLGLTACAANEPSTAGEGTETETASGLSGILVGAGASAQGEAQTAWIASFLDVEPGVEINYDPAGSGAGRDTFQAGAGQFAGSDRAFKVDEIAEGPFETCAPDSNIVELPLYISPIAVIFNLDGIDSLNLAPATIANIFLGNITNWNDPAIAALNDGVELPDLAITAVHRSDDSGTTENFTDYLSVAAADVWTHEADGEWPIAGGESAQGTSGVVDAVTNGNGTIGYADASRAGGLGTISVKVGDEFVPYSPEAAAAVVDASPLEEGRSAGDLAVALERDTAASGAYPIVLISYLIGCETYADAAQAELVKAYFTHAASAEGQALAAEAAGSAPISDEMREKVTAAIDSIS